MTPLDHRSAHFNEKTEVREEEPRGHDPVSPLALWAVLLTPPMAALIAQSASYAFAVQVCDRGWWSGFIHLPHAVMLLTGAAAWWFAMRFHRRFANVPGEDGGVAARSRFVALLAVVGSPFFLLIIAGMWMSLAVLRTCQ